MALIVEDGTGKTTAESYVSVTEADVYLTDRFPDTLEWFKKTDGDKEQFLRLATGYVDTEYSGRWIGKRQTLEQALEWPRAYAVDLDGFTFPSDSIPNKVKAAVIEAARLMTGGNTLREEMPSAPVKRTKIGPLEKEYQDGVNTTNQENPYIYPLLKGLITGGKYNVRVEMS